MTAQTTASENSKPSGLIPGLYRRFQFLSAKLESPFLLLVRVYWGWQFAHTGWGKLRHLSHVAHYFSTLNIPAPGPTAFFVSALELVGGILLIAGLGTRFIGLLLAIDMFVAYLTTDLTALASIISNPDAFYNDAAYTFLFASLIALIFGAGRYSVDYLIWRKQGC
ncbi:MAG TPA: DoxX family protein [Acidobacteriaceae bacterium]|jgi:putative oxidoreductase|nr:DoxX family protein [Acidobacteriaceae bacterium]